MSNDDTIKTNGEMAGKVSTTSPSANSTSTPATSVTAPTPAANPEVLSRFAGPGVDFKGKLIGVEEVSEPRGDKMCQVAMAKMKAGVRVTGDHKQRITINISLDGVKIIDEKSSEVLHCHEVSQIAFIARDNGDSRAFGYVCRRTEGSHRFIGIKTEKTAEGVVQSLRDLFQTVFDLKKNKPLETNGNTEKAPITSTDAPQNKQDTEVEKKATEDLTSLILDFDVSLPKTQTGHFSPTSSVMFDPWAAISQNNAHMMQQPQPFMAAPAGLPFYQQPVAVPANPNVSAGMMPAYPSHGIAMPAQAYPGAPGWPSPMAAASGSGPMPGQQWSASPYNVNLAAASVGNAAVHPRDPFAQPPPGTAPMIPARRLSPSNPFTGSPSTASHAGTAADPFAELAVLSGASSGAQSSQQLGKKAEKKDFYQEPPKPSLFDITHQQQQQQLQQLQTQQPPQTSQESTKDLFGSTPFSSLTASNDPFA